MEHNDIRQLEKSEIDKIDKRVTHLQFKLCEIIAKRNNLNNKGRDYRNKVMSSWIAEKAKLFRDWAQQQLRTDLNISDEQLLKEALDLFSIN